MAQIWRVTVTWTGGKIGTGYTNLFFNTSASTAQLAADAARSFFFTALGSGGQLPQGVVLTFPAVVDTIEATNGQLTSNTPITAPVAINGADSGAYAAVSGACVTWRTGDFVAGHRVRGRTFLVPLGATGWQNDGSLATSTISTINTAAAAIVAAAPEFVVWRRPDSAAASNGSTHIVATGTVSDKAAYLTSRR